MPETLESNRSIDLVESLGNFVLRFDEWYRATLRADIWIHRPTGGVCRERD